MADEAGVYTLTTNDPDEPGSPLHVIDFNTAAVGDVGVGSDVYYITDIQGLDGAPIRAQVDNQPVADGGIRHDFWKSGRHILISGLILVQESRVGENIQIARNVMEEALRAALRAALRTEGTLVWTPVGLSENTMNVVNEIPLECSGVLERRFTFGLYAANPDSF